MKLLSAILLLLCASAHAQQPICNPGYVTGTIECSFYVITSSTPSQDTNTPYSALVPYGEQRSMRITHAVVNAFMTQPKYTGQHVLLIESPAGSGNWRTPLCWQRDGGGACQSGFYPGITLKPGDELCLQSYSGSDAKPTGASYSIHYMIGP